MSKWLAHYKRQRSSDIITIPRKEKYKLSEHFRYSKILFNFMYYTIEWIINTHNCILTPLHNEVANFIFRHRRPFHLFWSLHVYMCISVNFLMCMKNLQSQLWNVFSFYHVYVKQNVFFKTNNNWKKDVIKIEFSISRQLHDFRASFYLAWNTILCSKNHFFLWLNLKSGICFLIMSALFTNYLSWTSLNVVYGH